MKAEEENDESKKKKPQLLRNSERYFRSKLQGKTFLVPSFVTVLGIFCGFLAIISALKGRYDYSAKCIAIAIILDGLDGRVARRLNATSEFGKEFDSLSDVISFGVAPAVVLYTWAFANLADEIGILISYLFVVCTATRLARFNIQTNIKKLDSSFTGLPSPGAAAAIAALVYSFPSSPESPAVVFASATYIIILSFLMVSTIPYLSVKKIQFSKENPNLVLLSLALLVALIWYHSKFLILILCAAYVLSGPVAYMFTA